jgi:hypothetical protein
LRIKDLFIIKYFKSYILIKFKMPEKALTLDELKRRRSVRKETEVKIGSMMMNLGKSKKETKAAPKVEEKVVSKKEEKVSEVVTPPPVKEQKTEVSATEAEIAKAEAEEKENLTEV